MKPGSLLGQGRTAEVFAWDQDFVLKLYYDWCPPEWIENEVNLSRHVEHLRLPVTRLVDRFTVDGRQGIVYERVRGPSLLQLLTSRPWQVVTFARLLARLQADIHTRSGTGFPSLRTWLNKAICQASPLSAGEKEKILCWLERLPEQDALCHFDFHPDQVLMTETGPVIIDWMTACQGNSLADVARTSLVLTYGSPPGERESRDAIIALFRRVFHGLYLREYLALHPGVRRVDVEAWKVPVAAARLYEAIESETPDLLTYLRQALEDEPS